MQITNGKLFVVSMNMNRSLSPRSDDYVNVLPKFDSLEGNILVRGKFKDFSVATTVENILWTAPAAQAFDPRGGRTSHVHPRHFEPPEDASPSEKRERIRGARGS